MGLASHKEMQLRSLQQDSYSGPLLTQEIATLHSVDMHKVLHLARVFPIPFTWLAKKGKMHLC